MLTTLSLKPSFVSHMCHTRIGLLTLTQARQVGTKLPVVVAGRRHFCVKPALAQWSDSICFADALKASSVSPGWAATASVPPGQTPFLTEDWVGLTGQNANHRNVDLTTVQEDSTTDNERPRNTQRRLNRLSEAQILEVIDARALGQTINEIAEQFEVHRTTVMRHLKRNASS